MGKKGSLGRDSKTGRFSETKKSDRSKVDTATGKPKPSEPGTKKK